MKIDHRGLYTPLLRGAVGVLVAGVFVADLSLPLGIAGGVPYVIPVTLSLLLPGRLSTAIVALVCVALTGAGLVLSPPGSEAIWMVLLNRGYAVLAIGLVVVLARMQHRIAGQNTELASQKLALEALYEMGAGLSALLDVQTIKDTAVNKTRELFHCDTSGLALLHEDSGTIHWELMSGAMSEAYRKLSIAPGQCVGGQVVQSGQPLILEDASHCTAEAKRTLPLLDMEGLQSILVAPIQIGNKAVGALMAGQRQPNFFKPHDLKLLMGLANQVAVAINNAQLYERLGAVSALEERERLARELHDGLAQLLGFMLASASTAGEMLDRNEVAAAEQHVARLKEVIQEANLDLRQSIEALRISRELEPGAIATPGRVIQEVADMEDVEVHLEVSGRAGRLPLPAGVEVQAVRILQEALRNIRKHAGVLQADVCVNAEDRWLTIAIRDSGSGFDEILAAEKDKHFGLRTMRERAESVGGSLVVETTPGAGTALTVRLPLNKEDE